MAKKSELYERAEKGDVYSQYILAQFYQINGRYKKAAYWYEKAAEQGHTSAQCRLGFACEYGQGVEQDYEKAIYWYERAAELRYPFAFKCLGDCYKNGHGFEQSDVMAACCYDRAVELCIEIGASKEAEMENYYGLAAYRYFKAAEQGDIFALLKTGNCYEKGQGIRQDCAMAFKCYEAAAKSGEPCGQFHLGRCYEHGIGVEKNSEKAKQFYKQAAENGCIKGLTQI